MISKDQIKQIEQIEKHYEGYIKSLMSMEIGEVKENTIHRLKRIDKYTWEYICPCCNGKRIAIGSK